MTSSVAFDSNVLVYPELDPKSAKGRRAAELLARCQPGGIIAAQALAELLAVVRRKAPDGLEAAVRQVEAYGELFTIVPTGIDIVLAAGGFSDRYQLQLWDSVIWQASRRGGASILLSEDLQDGFSAEGMRVVDPFAAEPSPILRALLAR